MSAVAEVMETLEAALKTVDELSSAVYRDPGAAIRPPGAVIGPPALQWETPVHEPTSARFLIYVIEQADDRAMERLWDLVPLVAAALDNETDAVVTRADPGSYSSGGKDLPAYLVEIEVSL